MKKRFTFLKVFLTFFLVIFFQNIAYSAKGRVTGYSAVYSAPDFDAQVLSYVSKGQTFSVSKRIFKHSTIGSFRRIKLDKSTYGFISDVDIQLLSKDRKSPSRHKVESKDIFKTEDSFLALKHETTRSLYQRSRFGFGFASLRVPEKLDNKTYNSSHQFYSFKLTWSSWSIRPRPLDIHFLYSGKPPKFYKNLCPNQKCSQIQGFAFVTDMSLPFLLSGEESWFVYYFMGVSVRGTNAKLKYTEGSMVRKKKYFGVLGGLGALWKFSDRLGVEGDFRYHYSGNFFFESGQVILQWFF